MAANDNVTSVPSPGVTPLLPLGARTPPDFLRPLPGGDRLDAILVVVVLAFAFLTASFAAGNSDFFFQTASGKLLAQGRYQFGVDPFTTTTEGVYWTNNSWLFGVVTHAVYDAFPGHGTDDNCTGGVILVVAKALLVALLAWLLIAVGRCRGQSLWIPAACAALAILAMSPRLFLHSTTLSYVYLGVTLFLLRRPRWNPPPTPEAATKRGKANAIPAVTVGYPFKAFWFILPLCILWVNTDGWFLLGPLTVGLYLAGELIEQAQSHAADRGDRPASGELRTLGYVFLASIAVCFINPHHYHVFTLPPQLGLTGAGDKLHDDFQFKVLFVSPFEDLYYGKLRVGKSVAGIAYFPLLVLSLLSFGLNFRSIRPWRIVVWLPFAALSAAHARAIPFFAVVAGPILALNCLDFAAQIAGAAFTKKAGWRAWRVGGRVLCVILGLGLIVGTIPGWVQAQPYDKRRVAWYVHVEPSWRETAAQVARWREQGMLADGAGWFNTSPDAVNYMAYFCEGQRGFFDARLQLFDGATADYLTVRKALSADEDDPASKEPRSPEAPWRAVFARRNVRFVILHGETLGLIKPLSKMLAAPEEWTPVYADGDTYIFGWTDPREKQGLPFAGMRLNYESEAFGRDARPVRRARQPAAPRVREWYEALWEPEPPRAQAVNVALFHTLYEDAEKLRWQQKEQRQWTGTLVAASFAAGLTVPLAMFDQGSPILRNHALGLEPPAPAATYLTVRQIQESLADHPDDAQAYLALGHAYYKLLWGTPERERTFNNGFPHPTLIRQTQVVTALNRALRLDPNLEAAHAILGDHYTFCRGNRVRVPNFFEGNLAINYIDVELQHREEQLRLSKTHGDPPKGLEDEVKRLRKEVERQVNLYEINAANKPVVQRAVTALQAGLGDKAQSLLEKADAADLTGGPNAPPAGFILRIKLLLSLGRVDEVREALTDYRQKLAGENKRPDWGLQPGLNLPTFEWFELLAAAAAGDYPAADGLLEGLASQVHRSNEKSFPALAARFGAQLILVEEGGQALFPMKGGLLQETHGITVQLLQQEADLRALRGWLALEAGELALARQELQATLELDLMRDAAPTGAEAAGVGVPGVQGRRLSAQARLLGLHTLPLAATGLRWLETAVQK